MSYLQQTLGGRFIVDSCEHVKPPSRPWPVLRGRERRCHQQLLPVGSIRHRYEALGSNQPADVALSSLVFTVCFGFSRGGFSSRVFQPPAVTTLVPGFTPLPSLAPGIDTDTQAKD